MQERRERPWAIQKACIKSRNDRLRYGRQDKPIRFHDFLGHLSRGYLFRRDRLSGTTRALADTVSAAAHAALRYMTAFMMPSLS